MVPEGECRRMPSIRRNSGPDEKVKETREIFNWAIVHSNLDIHCKVMDYKYESYKFQFFTRENQFMMPIRIPEEWVKGSHPDENVVHDRL